MATSPDLPAMSAAPILKPTSAKSKQMWGTFGQMWGTLGTVGRMWGTVAALLCLALAATAGFAKDKKPLKKDYALIYGTVWSAQQHPVAGVAIKIRRADEKKARWELMSDRNGEFAQRVPAGKMDYVIWAELKGAKGKSRPEITAHVENDERVDVGLHLTE